MNVSVHGVPLLLNGQVKWPVSCECFDVLVFNPFNMARSTPVNSSSHTHERLQNIRIRRTGFLRTRHFLLVGKICE